MTIATPLLRAARVVLAGALVATAACGNSPTAPSAPGTPAAVRGPAPSGPAFSGYMLSSGRQTAR
jgi:hypothetical protein